MKLRATCLVSLIIVLVYCVILASGCSTARRLCVESCSGALKSSCEASKSHTEKAKAADADIECIAACDAIGRLVGDSCLAACNAWCSAEGYPVAGCERACSAVCGGGNGS